MLPETCSGEIEKNKMIKSIMKKQVFSIQLNFEFLLFCYVFEEMFSSIPMLHVMLFALVKKRSNSRSQMFFKTGVLKNFVIFTGKQLCYLFLIMFQDWSPAFLFKNRLQHSCWSLARITSIQRLQTNVVSTLKFEVFKNSFFIEDLLFIPKFYLMIDNWYFRYTLLL